ncbi:putative chorismate mutase [Rosellinia necatrix]|uniref:Putative chorismate mutase n=1 Tax=Rosellinia necatrix TaxID=77044 RepID=A0A1W2TSY8_ROSNE|nr:putative chorismate mutase [Rosellinia necatrix]
MQESVRADRHRNLRNHQLGPIPLEGYAAVAGWVARDPDGEAFVFRRFGGLAARNLLCLQSELLSIEKRLADFDKEDARDAQEDLGAKDAARTWETLVRRSEAGHDGARRRMELLTGLRSKIKEYHEALLLQSQIAQLRRPSRRVLDALRHWFSRPEPALGGEAKKFLDDEDDLVALNAPVELDYLSQFLRSHWAGDTEISRDGRTQIRRFDERSVSVAVNVVTILVAAVFLGGSIAGFYYVRDDAARLGMIAGFTSLFALSVALITNARRAEIFAATAAYAAVLVVFVSGDLSNSSKGTS